MRKSTYAQIKRSIRRSGLTVFLTRIGTGRHVQIGIYGPDSAQVAAALDHMLTRCPMSGDGSSPPQYDRYGSGFSSQKSAINPI